MRQYDETANIRPSCHYEPRMEHFWPEKDGEWYTVRRTTPGTRCRANPFPSWDEWTEGSYPAAGRGVRLRLSRVGITCFWQSENRG